MKKTALRLLALAVCLTLVFLPGCGERKGEIGETEWKGRTLTLAYIARTAVGNNGLIDNVKMMFRRQYPDVELVIEDYYDVSFLKQIGTQLMAGKGPDLLYLDAGFVDLNKMARSGAFADLTEVLEGHKDLKSDAYIQQALDAGKVDGRQYAVPLNMMVYGLTTSQEMLERSGFDMDQCTDLYAFMKVCREYQTGAGSSAKPYLFNDPVQLWDVIESLDNWIDYSDKTVNLDRPEVREIIDFYKECVFPSQPFLASKKSGTVLADREAVFDVAWNNFFFETCTAIGGVNSYDEAVFLPLPNRDGTFGVVQDVITVASGSKNKDLAFAFLETMLSYSAQAFSGSIYGYTPSICKAAWPDSLTAFDMNFTLWEMTDNSTSKRISQIENVPDKDAQKILTYLEGINQVTLPHNDALDILRSTMLPYFQDKKSYEACIAEAQAKLSIYMTE